MIETTRKQISNQANKKLFESICLYGFGIICIRLVINLFISSSWLPCIADIITGSTVILLYSLSKKGKKIATFFWLGVVLTQLGTFFLWFGLGGIKGPAIVFNLGLSVVYIALYSGKTYWKVGLAVIVSTIAAIVLEQLNPMWVVAYASQSMQLIDSGIAFLAMVVIVIGTTQSMKNRYEAEQEFLDKNAEELVAEKKKTEEKRDLLATLKELQSSFLLKQEVEHSFDVLLKQLLAITNSQYGFIGEIGEKTDQRILETFAIMDAKNILENTNLLDDDQWKKNGESTFQPLLDTVLKTKTYILSDQVPNDNETLKAFLGFPILYDNAIIGMVGVANTRGYEDVLIEALAPFISTYGTIIQNARLKRKQKNYEEELRKSKEVAEQAVAAKNRLFTNISHEFRTPLSLIVGPVSAILKQPQGTLVEKDTRSSLNMVLRNSEKMLNYVGDIMDLAKLNSNKLEIRKQTNHWESFIKTIYNTFKVQTVYRKIDYRLDYNVPTNLVLDFDNTKMEKIINNLLSNAFKYTPDGGKIKLSVTDLGSSIQVEVRDTGIGIEEENLPHIFDRFYQTQAAKESDASGSGVGLALAQELAVLQGFEIEVVSVFEEGTCFSFNMPRNESVNVTPTPVVVEANSSSEVVADAIEQKVEDVRGNKERRSILIVEDNRDMAAFVKLVLGTEYKVDLAENGAIGLAMLEKDPKRFDLVITDLMMPEMDGYELLQQIKSKEWGVNLPVIVLTAKSGEASKLKALTIGVDEYLTKPFSVDELTIHVRNLIANSVNRKSWKEKEMVGVEEQASHHQTDTRTSTIKETKNEILNREKIETARKVVLENIDETEFAVDDLARALAVSKRQLYRFMQLNTGLTPLKFINEIRLQEARRLLEEGACSTVKEVSYSIGFISTRHFSKNYNIRFGKKPSEYFR